MSPSLLVALALAAAPTPAADPAGTVLAPGPAVPQAPGTPPQPAPLAVHSRLTRATPRLGEPFDWEVEVRHPPGTRVALPAALDLPPFQAEAGGCRRAEAGAEVITTCTVHLALFELGGHDLPALRLQAATPEGTQVLDVPGPRVEAAGVIDPKAPPDQLALRPPAGPVPLELPTWRPAWIGLGAAAALAALWLAWRAWRRRTARAAAPPPPVPADVRFGRRLDALEARRLAEQGRGREHFFEASEAVREYLEALTGVNAPDLTTAELLAALGAAADPRLDLAALRAFSEEADLVKYAKAPAGGRECDAALRFARALLQRTTAALPTTASAGSTAAAPDGGASTAAPAAGPTTSATPPPPTP